MRNLDETIERAIRNRNASLYKKQHVDMGSSYVRIEKARQAQEGEVRSHGGRKMKKIGGKWVPLAERKLAPTSNNKKDTKGKKEPLGKNKTTIPSKVSRHHVGILRTIKKYINSNNYHEAHMLADRLPDNVKHEIPAAVWSKMVEADHKENMKSAAMEKKQKDFKKEPKKKKQ